MFLVAGMAALVVVGFFGPALSNRLAIWLELSRSLTLVLLFVTTMALTQLVLRLLRPVREQDPIPNADDPWAIGEGRGQLQISHLTVWFVVTLATGFYFIYPEMPANPLHVLLTLGAVAAGLFLHAPVRPSLWPPELPTLNPPADVREFAKQKANEGADALRLTFTFSFDRGGSVGGKLGNSNCHTISTWVCESEYQRLASAYHHQPQEDPDGYAVLGRYVSEELSDDLRRCAGQLWVKSRQLQLHSLETVQFVLAFTRDAIETCPQREPVSHAATAVYPLETLVNKSGTTLNRTLLAAALLHLLNATPLLVVSQIKGQPPTVGLAVPSRGETRLPSREMLSFENCSYYYFYWADDGKWSVGGSPVNPLIIPLAAGVE